MKYSRPTVLLVTSMLVAAPHARPQHAELRLDVAFPVPFGYVGGVREFADGRVMVADPLGRVLVIADMDAGSADTLGRIGGGPEEYRQPDAVFPLPGDSTLLVDLGNARSVALAPDGSFGTTSPLVQIGTHGALALVIPRFIDVRGRLYYEPETLTFAASVDSAPIVRLDRRAQRSDTVAYVRLDAVREMGRRGSRMLGGAPLHPRDDWAVGPDGSVAIMHGSDYSVSWISADGRVTRGPSTEYPKIRVGTAEKEAWLDAYWSSAISLRTRRTADGRRDITFSRGTSGARPDIDTFDWPDILPPFRPRRAVVSPEGELWVERYVAAGSPQTIDAFGRDARKVREFTLPQGKRVVAFGTGSVYLVSTDDMGLEWLERWR